MRFSGFHGKRMYGRGKKKITQSHIFQREKRSTQIFIGQIEFFFYVSKAVIAYRTCPWTGVPLWHVRRVYAVAWTTKTLPRPSLHALCIGLFLFCLSEMRAFSSTDFLFVTTILTIDEGSPSFFAASARFCFESRFATTQSHIPCLSTMGFASSWLWFWTLQNNKLAEPPKTSSTMRMAWRHSLHHCNDCFGSFFIILRERKIGKGMRDYAPFLPMESPLDGATRQSGGPEPAGTRPASPTFFPHSICITCFAWFSCSMYNIPRLRNV